MNVAEEFRQQTVAGHDEQHAALTKAHDQQYGRKAADSADRYGRSAPVIADSLQGEGNGSRRRLELHKGNHAGQYGGNGDVQNRADNQG